MSTQPIHVYSDVRPIMFNEPYFEERGYCIWLLPRWMYMLSSFWSTEMPTFSGMPSKGKEKNNLQRKGVKDHLWLFRSNCNSPCSHSGVCQLLTQHKPNHLEKLTYGLLTALVYSTFAWHDGKICQLSLILMPEVSSVHFSSLWLNKWIVLHSWKHKDYLIRIWNFHFKYTSETQELFQSWAVVHICIGKAVDPSPFKLLEPLLNCCIQNWLLPPSEVSLGLNYSYTNRISACDKMHYNPIQKYDLIQ